VPAITAYALAGLPEIHPGEDLAAAILAVVGEAQELDGAVLCIAHKVISKAEGSVVELAGVRPSDRALQIAREQDRDPRVVQVVLDESVEILRSERGVLITRTPHGFVCANAGVDTSNVAAGGQLILLPRDPDASARALRARLRELTGSRPAVLISDSFGRAWRHGQVDVAIGLAGLAPLDDWRGREDSMGLRLQATWLAVADAAAGAADLARAKDSREPVVIVHGLARHLTDEDGPGAAALLRPVDEDLFR
jgi:coenzyme F420-0:L-glutamate ligase/coenzyme F420-1:gamma-L-glutamate ligase